LRDERYKRVGKAEKRWEGNLHPKADENLSDGTNEESHPGKAARQQANELPTKSQEEKVETLDNRRRSE
jgi:hypothetical protein